MRTVLKILRLARWMVFSFSLISCQAHGKTDQQHLKPFQLKGVKEYGDLTKFLDDDRAVYYFGALIWKDPQWDKNDFWITTIIALHKPSSTQDTLLDVDRFEAELFSVRKPAFKIRPSEIEYFNATIIPALKTHFPSFRSNPPESLQIMGFATEQHFEDSKSYFRSRSRHKIIPEQPLYRLGWFLTDGNKYRPAYEVQSQPGADATEFWNSVQEAQSARGVISGEMQKAKIDDYERNMAKVNSQKVGQPTPADIGKAIGLILRAVNESEKNAHASSSKSVSTNEHTQTCRSQVKERMVHCYTEYQCLDCDYKWVCKNRSWASSCNPPSILSYTEGELFCDPDNGERFDSEEDVYMNSCQ